MLHHHLDIYAILFFVFSAMLIATSLLVIFTRHTVQAALWLILTFVISAMLWMMLQAEFLALMLVFVYVGAVLTLFLFVVMMINSDKETKATPIRKAIPIALIVMVFLFAAEWGIIFHMGGLHAHALFSAQHHLLATSTTYNNTMQLGILLYTHYIVAFELAGAILLVAIIGAISLAFFGRPRDDEKIVTQQRQASKASGLRMVDLPKGDAS